MSTYRIEITPASDGMYAASAYEGEQDIACANSGPIVHSMDEAREGIAAMFEQAWPAKDPFSVDPSIGV